MSLGMGISLNEGFIHPLLFLPKAVIPEADLQEVVTASLDAHNMLSGSSSYWLASAGSPLHACVCRLPSRVARYNLKQVWNEYMA